MQTDKPLISIVIAVYEPRMDWLREQLESLNDQTYPNLELIVCDDCSPTVPHEKISELIAGCITSFKYSIIRSESNLGSNNTFELLTREAKGEYIAYCDQDDIWLPEKLDTLFNAITENNALLVCSDMYIINENGVKIADSITEVRKHHVFRSGEGLAPKLLFSNFVTGCTMLVKTVLAKAAVPFCPYMVHDHWLALFCADRGKVISLRDALIKYRIHDSNQTSVMAGVYDKKSYLQVRIINYLKRMYWLRDYFQCSRETGEKIIDGIKWLEARKMNMESHRGIRTIWKYRSFSCLPSIFEIVAAFFPDKLFMFFIELNRKNII